MRKVTVEVKIKMLIHADETIEISEVMDEIEYDFSYQGTDADIIDTVIEDYEIKDSR